MLSNRDYELLADLFKDQDRSLKRGDITETEEGIEGYTIGYRDGVYRQRSAKLRYFLYGAASVALVWAGTALFSGKEQRRSMDSNIQHMDTNSRPHSGDILERPFTRDIADKLVEIKPNVIK